MKNFFLICSSLLLVLSCQRSDRLYENEAVGYTQGTTYQIKYLAASPLRLNAAFDSIFNLVDRSMSTYKPNSFISKLNRGETKQIHDPYFKAVLARSLEIANETGGYFDPTVGPLVQAWGFGPTPPELKDIRPQIDSILPLTGHAKVKIVGNQVKMPSGFQIDFNAIAQGYTVDLVADFLEAKGIENYMVEIGGEIKARGINSKGKIWVIGIDKPSDDIDQQDRFQVVINLNNRSLATSGNYRKFWTDETTGMRYAHTIDPHLGRPARNSLLSVSVLAKSCMDADAYATACMAMGAEQAWKFVIDKKGVEAYLIVASPGGGWEVKMTDGFRAQIKQNPHAS